MKTVDLNFRIDTTGMVARFWADLAFAAIRQLGNMPHDSAAAACRDALDEVAFFDVDKATEENVSARKQFECGWSALSSLFDGRYARDK